MKLFSCLTVLLLGATRVAHTSGSSGPSFAAPASRKAGYSEVSLDVPLPGVLQTLSMERVSHGGFTLAEVQIGMALTLVILGALFTGSLGMQKALRGSEAYAAHSADQRRLLDYVGRDIRRSLRITATDASGNPITLPAEGVTIADRASLVVTLPPYYKSNNPADGDFDVALPVVTTGSEIGYGTAQGFAPEVLVTFRKLFVGREGSVCWIRVEAGAEEVIVRKAENLNLRVSLASDGRSCALQAWFRSQFSDLRPLVSSYDRILLRNQLNES